MSGDPPLVDDPCRTAFAPGAEAGRRRTVGLDDAAHLVPGRCRARPLRESAQASGATVSVSVTVLPVDREGVTAGGDATPVDALRVAAAGRTGADAPSALAVGLDRARLVVERCRTGDGTPLIGEAGVGGHALGDMSDVFIEEAVSVGGDAPAVDRGGRVVVGRAPVDARAHAPRRNALGNDRRSLLVDGVGRPLLRKDVQSM